MSRPLVTRTEIELHPDPSRVVPIMYLPGQEIAMTGESRSSAVLARVLTLNEHEVTTGLAHVLSMFNRRHHDLSAVFKRHFDAVEHRLGEYDELAPEQRELIGAYFTQEYSVESAGLFNPSLVAHPDQSGVPEDHVRFIMSVRTVGAGYISSIGFRTGLIGPAGEMSVDPADSPLRVASPAPVMYSRRAFALQLAEQGAERGDYDFALDALPVRFTRDDLGRAFALLAEARMTQTSATSIIEKFRRIAANHYAMSFASDTPLDGQVIMPQGPSEIRGMEDVRFVEMTHPNGVREYRGTYTAFDGSRVEPHLIRTKDFHHFDVTPMSGPGAKNKGMALFPRQVRGRYVSLARADRESNELAWSDDGYHWGTPWLLQVPEQPWELVHIGNCGSPIETEYGWLVLTHGVGPMHEYAIGAILLDLHDPSVVIGHLDEPLITSRDEERTGVVPNVVYSCGGLVHNGNLILPYGCSDFFIRVAIIDMTKLLSQLAESLIPVRPDLGQIWN